MRKTFLTAIVGLIPLLALAQVMNIHTTGGVTPFNISDIDSITFSADTSGGNAWTTRASMPTARWGLSAAAANGKVYAMGGILSGGSGGCSIVDAYDPTANSWATKAPITPIPTKRDAAAIAVVDNKIYLIGGESDWHVIVNTVECYDPAANSWQSKNPMPTARQWAAAAVVNGKIYVCGGMTASASLGTMEVYDPVADSWSTKTSMPTARHGLVAKAVGGLVYAIGGQNLGSGTHYSKVEAYDTATNSWTTKAPMTVARRALSGAAINGVIYAIGGYDGSSDLRLVEAYDAAANAWTTKPQMPTARSHQTSADTNGKIYTVGGLQNGSTVLNINEEFTP